MDRREGKKEKKKRWNKVPDPRAPRTHWRNIRSPATIPATYGRKTSPIYSSPHGLSININFSSYHLLYVTNRREQVLGIFGVFDEFRPNCRLFGKTPRHKVSLLLMGFHFHITLLDLMEIWKLMTAAAPLFHQVWWFVRPISAFLWLFEAGRVVSNRNL